MTTTLLTPAIGVTDVSGDPIDPTTLSGTLTFDGRAVARFSFETPTTLRITDVVADLDQARILGVLSRVTDHFVIHDDQLVSYPSAPVLTLARGFTPRQAFLVRDHAAIPDAPFFVLADDDRFADGAVRETMIVPCVDAEQAARVRALLRSAAVQSPFSWEDPRFGNVRIAAEKPPAPTDHRTVLSLAPTHERSWIWQEHDAVPPPDAALETQTAFMNTRDVVVGEFAVPDGRLIVMDPCYDLGDAHIDKYLTVRPGRYRATARLVDVVTRGALMPQGGMHDSDRVAGVELRHVDTPEAAPDLRQVSLTIPVDTARVAIVSAERNPVRFGGDDSLAELTVLDGAGFVTSSGFGDGEYAASAAYDDHDQIVAISIPFIIEAFAPDLELRAPMRLDPDPGDLGPEGAAASYLHTLSDWRSRYRTAIADDVASTLADVQAGTAIDAERRETLLAVARAAEVSLNEVDRRGGEVLRGLLERPQIETPSLRPPF